MSRLYDYYGMKVNALCLAVMRSNEYLIDELLENENFKEINEGVSPLYFIGYNCGENLDDAKRNQILRIFRKILNNERFTNVNTVFYDGTYSSTLLYHLLYKKDSVFETCCVDLINSPKYQLIDYPGNYGNNSSDLICAINHEKILAAKAIMDHPDFTKIDFGLGATDFVDKCRELYESDDLYSEEIRNALQVIMDEYVLRERNENYNATDKNIATKLTNAIQILTPYFSGWPHPPMSAACSYFRNNTDMIIEIVKHPKFTGEMLSKHIKDIADRLSYREAYETFHQNPKIEGWTPAFYGELAYYFINHGKVGMLKALLENENVCLSEEFYSYYKYFLKNAILATTQRFHVLDDGVYYEYMRNIIFGLIDEKYRSQLAKHQFDTSKFIELTKEDYSILKNGMVFFYDLIYKNGNESSEQNEIDGNLKKVLICDEQNNKIGPFFNIFDRDRIWKFFNEYQSFDEFRQMVLASAKETKRTNKM